MNQEGTVLVLLVVVGVLLIIKLKSSQCASLPAPKAVAYALNVSGESAGAVRYFTAEDAAEYNKLKSSYPTVVYADWCGACKNLIAMLQQIKTDKFALFVEQKTAPALGIDMTKIGYFPFILLNDKEMNQNDLITWLGQ